MANNELPKIAKLDTTAPDYLMESNKMPANNLEMKNTRSRFSNKKAEIDPLRMRENFARQMRISKKKVMLSKKRENLI